MKLIVTGSIAYDYLMSFPGKFTEHFLPEHMQRVSLSFLVDTMDKRRGGCAPNIAYTLALLGERPYLMGTAGQDFGEYRHWLEAAGVDTSLVQQVPGQVHRVVLLQHRHREQPDRVVLHRRDGARGGALVPDGRGSRPRRSSRRTIRPRWCSTPRSAGRWGSRSSSIPASSARACPAPSCATASTGARIVICNDYEFELIRQKTGHERGRRAEGGGGADRHARRGRLLDLPEAAAAPTCRRCRRRRIVDPTGVGDAFRGGLMKGWRPARRYQTCAQLGSVAATYALEHLGGQSHAYTPAEFKARTKRTSVRSPA